MTSPSPERCPYCKSEDRNVCGTYLVMDPPPSPYEREVTCDHEWHRIERCPRCGSEERGVPMFSHIEDCGDDVLHHYCPDPFHDAPQPVSPDAGERGEDEIDAVRDESFRLGYVAGGRETQMKLDLARVESVALAALPREVRP